MNTVLPVMTSVLPVHADAGLAAEVAFDFVEAGIDQPSAINCDGLHTVAQSSLVRRIGAVEEATLRSVCRAISYALGC